jgi:predicted exporter
MKLKNYGYMIKAKTTVNTSNAMQARVVYNQVKSIILPYKGVISYAPFYFLVENSAFIKHDAQIIMGISTILLLILYFVILKNFKLFFNTIIAIASSILGAVLLTSLFFDSINILALVFGVSVTTISIDYMFHYYFHGDFSKKGFLFQKRVFFGFITTIGVFIIFSFIDIELFSQLAIFSVISLGIAFGLFSWVFVYLGISPPLIKEKETASKSFNPLHVTLVSLILLGFSYHNLRFDNNLKNLDYKNEKLTKIAKIFSKARQNDKYQAIIIKAQTKEKLLQKYEKIALDYPSLLGIGKFVYSEKKCNKKLNKIKNFNFKKIKKIIDITSKDIGFKDKTFSKAYMGINHLKCDMNIINDIKFKIIKDGDKFYTMALIFKTKLKKSHKDFETINLAKSLSKDTINMKNKLARYMFASVFFIILVLFFVSGFDMLYPLTYLLFPISVVLFFITIFGKINIMHIFALVILVAISIDYGIYLHKTKTLVQTKMAIRYALLSTFFGFGVLIFSKTTALHSIGFVITIGIGSIFVLLYAKIPWKNK